MCVYACTYGCDDKTSAVHVVLMQVKVMIRLVQYVVLMQVKVMRQQLVLFHNAIAAYFSGNQTALDATLQQFSVPRRQSIDGQQ